MMFRILGLDVQCLHGGLFIEPFLFVHQFCGPLKKWTRLGLMIDGDEMCLRLGENGGRVNMDIVLADHISSASSANVLVVL